MRVEQIYIPYINRPINERMWNDILDNLAEQSPKIKKCLDNITFLENGYDGDREVCVIPYKLTVVLYDELIQRNLVSTTFMKKLKRALFITIQSKDDFYWFS